MSNIGTTTICAVLQLVSGTDAIPAAGGVVQTDKTSVRARPAFAFGFGEAGACLSSDVGGTGFKERAPWQRS